MSERPPPLEWLDVADVAAELGVSVEEVRVLIRDEGLPATRRNGRPTDPWALERQLLERWLRQSYAATSTWVAANPRGGGAMWNPNTGAHF